MSLFGFINNAVKGLLFIIQKQDIASTPSYIALDSSSGFIRLTGSTNTDIKGISAGLDGQLFTIYNQGTATSLIRNENIDAIASNRIKTSFGENEVINPGVLVNLIYDGTASRWILQPIGGITYTGYIQYQNAEGFTRTGNDTFTVADTMRNQSIFMPGLPIRYRSVLGTGDFYYGIIISYSGGTVTIGGIVLPNPLGEFCVGPTSKVKNEIFQVTGELTTGDDKLKTVMKTLYEWGFPDAYIVYARGSADTAAVGADLNLMFAKNTASTDLLNSVLNLAQSTNSVDTGVTLNSTNYKFAFNDKFFLNIDQVGSSTKGSDLTVRCTFVFPTSLNTFLNMLGFFGGGNIGLNDVSTIDYIDLTLVVGDAIDRGDLTVARRLLAGVSGTKYGFYGGGIIVGRVDTIDYINLSLTSGNAIDRGDLSLARDALAGVSGSTYGFYGGGDTGSLSNVIDYIDLSLTSGNASDRGDLSVPKWALAGTSGNNYGFYGGGGDSGGVSNIIDYIDLSLTSGNATDRGDLTVARYILAGIGGTTYGFYGGGDTGSLSNVIDYIDLSLISGNASDRGDLSVARSDLSGTTGATYGFYGGGNLGSYSHVIDYIDLTLTTGNATDSGSLTEGRKDSSGI